MYTPAVFFKRSSLRRGAEINIDAKTREQGCSEYWKHGEPEFAPEIWSVMPGGKFNISRERSKAGWTLNEANKADYIYLTFHPADTDKVYLLPFQLYRMAFRRNLAEWREWYQVSVQESRRNGSRWQSMCVFVPATIVLDSIYWEMDVLKRDGMQKEMDFS